MPLAAPNTWLSPLPIARSGAGPGPLPWRSAARGAGRAADASPDCAGPRHRAFAVCSARSSSSTPWSASIAAPGGDWSEPSPGDRSPRSPPCAEASQGAAPRVLGASGAELLAPLRPTTGKHAATTLRSHASAEAVFPLPGALLGLVGPLHECVPVLVQRRRCGSITQERLASSPASREWPCAVARLALPGDSSDAPSGVSNLRRNLNESIARPERVLLHYRDPRGPTPI